MKFSQISTWFEFFIAFIVNAVLFFFFYCEMIIIIDFNCRVLYNETISILFGFFFFGYLLRCPHNVHWILLNLICSCGAFVNYNTAHSFRIEVFLVQLKSLLANKAIHSVFGALFFFLFLHFFCLFECFIKNHSTNKNRTNNVIVHLKMKHCHHYYHH